MFLVARSFTQRPPITGGELTWRDQVLNNWWGKRTIKQIKEVLWKMLLLEPLVTISTIAIAKNNA
jgi:hypothetical protein